MTIAEVQTPCAPSEHELLKVGRRTERAATESSDDAEVSSLPGLDFVCHVERLDSLSPSLPDRPLRASALAVKSSYSSRDGQLQSSVDLRRCT